MHSFKFVRIQFHANWARIGEGHVMSEAEGCVGKKAEMKISEFHKGSEFH